MKSSSEEGSYLRLVDFYITQLQAESNKEEADLARGLAVAIVDAIACVDALNLYQENRWLTKILCAT